MTLWLLVKFLIRDLKRYHNHMKQSHILAMWLLFISSPKISPLLSAKIVAQRQCFRITSKSLLAVEFPF